LILVLLRQSGIAAAQALRGLGLLTAYHEISKDICIDQYHR
jgi:hypothetical protein